MELSLGLGLYLRPEVTVRADVEVQVFTQRLELLRSLHGVTYKPEANCPNCSRRLSTEEILKGFRPDPTDFDTECPKCAHRFQPNLIHQTTGVRTSLPFYCSEQTLDKLRPLAGLKPEVIAKEHQGVYHSTLTHFGSLRAGFAKISIDYPYEITLDWRNKVRPFLGHLSDAEIARCAGVSESSVGRLRRSLGIKRYRP